MKLNITIDDPLLEPFLPVIRRRHEKSVLKELEFTDRKSTLADILVCTGGKMLPGYFGNGLRMLLLFI